MAKKSTATSDVTSTKVVKQLSAPFAPADRMLKDHLRVLAEEYVKLFPFSQQIAKLEEQAKPIEKTIKETLNMIEAGTSEEVDCTMTIDRTTRRVLIERDDTHEIVEDREYDEDQDGQIDHNLK